MRKFRWVAALVFAGCGGCGLGNYWRDDAERINEAFPLSATLQLASDRLAATLLQAEPDTRARLTAEFAEKMEARASDCARGVKISRFDSAGDIRGKLLRKCFADADRPLFAWIQKQRLQSLLRLPPLVVAGKPPQRIATPIPFGEFAFARKAAVLGVLGRDRLALVDMNSGRVLFEERYASRASSGVLPSPNGRVFSLGLNHKVTLRDSGNGEVLATYPDYFSMQWLDSGAGILRSWRAGGGYELLDVDTGVITPLGSVSRNSSGLHRVYDEPPGFVYFHEGDAYQFELRHEAAGVRLVAMRQQPAPGVGGIRANSAMTSDGATLGVPGVDSFFTIRPGARDFDDDIRLTFIDVPGLVPRNVCPLDDANDLLMIGELPGTTELPRAYVYSLNDRMLSRLTDPRFSTGQGQVRCTVRIPAYHRAYLPLEREMVLVGTPSRTGKYSPGALAVHIADLSDERRRTAALEVEQTRPDASFVTPAIGKAPFAELAKDSRVFALGVYEAEARLRRSEGEITGPVRVVVNRSVQPVVLVLTSYEAVSWQLDVRPGANLQAILLGGYHDSELTGAAGVRVIRLGRVYAYQSGGEPFMRLNAEVIRWIGKGASDFEGRYYGSRYTVGSQ